MLLSKIDYILIAFSIASSIILITLEYFFYLNVLPIFLGLIFLTSLILQISHYRRLQFAHQSILKSQHSNYRETEALFSLFSTLKFRVPLPPMRGWAISPDFANTLVSLIYEHKPKKVLELGSGISTIVSGYCLQSLGEGIILSIDHDKEYQERSQHNLELHELSDITKVAHAPLVGVTLEGKDWLWYCPDFLEGLDSIDLLIIDGPPVGYQRMIRYPALPMLYKALNQNAIIVVDDGDRKDESEMVKMWLSQFNGLIIERVVSEKGLFILRKTSA